MPKLIWIDLETTGLDPVANRILEVCAFESDLADPFNAREVYHAVLAFPPERSSGTGTWPHPIVLEMHAKSGLWKECAEANKTLSDVEAELTAAMGPPPADSKEKPLLAGATVHFDRAFLRAWMPKVEALFGHRHYDTSAIKLFAQSLGMPKLEKKEAHRTREDILESIEAAKLCAEWCKTGALPTALTPAA